MKLKEGNFATTLEFSRDGSSLILGTNSGTILTITSTQWDIFSSLHYQELIDLGKEIQSLQFSPLELTSKFILSTNDGIV